MAIQKAVLLFIYIYLHYVWSNEEVNSEVDQSLPTVQLKQGKMFGVIQTSDSGRNYSAFMGIPYGTVPGRFMPPEPAGFLPENFVANSDSQLCIQNMEAMKLGIIGNEDCLTLHVYTPYLPTKSYEEKLPVMVYIYGGAFVFGSNTPMFYGPSHLMEQDIVLVLMNYRVGIFGFLATEDKSSPGNYGLLDQNLALQWVQENIVEFGGDQNKVTIFGESAGGASVIYHILSPLSAGLFQNAIAMSGSSLCPWALNAKPLEAARQVAKLMNCPSIENTQELVECLRNADAKDLARIPAKVSPVVEPEDGGLFLKEHPYKLLLEGRFNKVPVISGITLDEFATGLLFPEDPSPFYVPKDEFFEKVLIGVFAAAMDTADVTNFGNDAIEYLGNEYFGDIDFKNETALNIAFIQFFSDSNFGSPNDLTIRLLTSHDVPVYSYVFEYVSPVNAPTHLSGKPDVGHASDLAYIFETKLSFQGRKYSEEAKEFIKKYVALWTNFSVSSNPTPSEPFLWQRTYTEGENRFLRLGTEMEMSEDSNQKRISMWNEVLKSMFENEINGY